IREQDQARYQELVRLHHRVLPSQHSVHLLHQRQELPSGRSEAAAGRRVRRRRAPGAQENAGDRREGGTESQSPVAQDARRLDGQRVPSRRVKTNRGVLTIRTSLSLLSLQSCAVLLSARPLRGKNQTAYVSYEPEFRDRLRASGRLPLAGTPDNPQEWTKACCARFSRRSMEGGIEPR